ncbi:MAG: ParB N-terminal domain-containing protein, partial [Phycisphaerales bacterium]|nr:ParB N-terminal domain-containing protein [Phycisphaerales bacterium]
MTTEDMDYDVHPAAAIFPAINGEEFDQLVEDIRERGLLEPIVLDGENRVLDGRNRLRACQAAGVEPQFTTYDGDDPVGFVISMNIRRRQLTASQRAALAAELLPQFEDQAKDRQREHAGTAPGKGKNTQDKSDLSDGRAIAEAGRVLGVCATYVQKAKRLKMEAPGEFDAARGGSKSLRRAMQDAGLVSRRSERAVASRPASSEQPAPEATIPSETTRRDQAHELFRTHSDAVARPLAPPSLHEVSDAEGRAETVSE